MLYLFDPTEVHKFAGLSPDSQRDWRRRGFLNEVGKLQDNGRWKYSMPDLIQLTLARLLVERRIFSDIKDALRFASYTAQFVWFRMQPSDPDDRFQQLHGKLRYAAAFGSLVEGEEMDFKCFENLDSVFQFHLGVATICDLDVLSDEVRPRLQDAVAAYASTREA